MIRFCLNYWNLLRKSHLRQFSFHITVVSVLFALNFFSVTNLFSSSRGITQRNNYVELITENKILLKSLIDINNSLNISIDSITKDKDYDLLDQVIREFLGYLSEEDHLIILDN
jgi:hypothetical protein